MLILSWERVVSYTSVADTTLDARVKDDAAEELAFWKRGKEASAKVAAAAAAAKVKHDDEAAQRAKQAVAKK
ncbi:unnamed protein product, partial [Laminaria digitata]